MPATEPNLQTKPSRFGRTIERAKDIPLIKDVIGMIIGGTARKGFFSAVDQAIISLANFLASVYLARQLEPTEFGVYSVGFLLLYLARAIHQGLVIQPVSALGAVMDHNGYRRYASSSALMMILLAVLMSGGTALVGWALTRTEHKYRRIFEASSFGSPCSRIQFEEEGINLFAEGVRP